MQARYGMVHGRFQPFHYEHLQYTPAALACCDHLIVGITHPDPALSITEASDPKRHHLAANVFT
jgi:cytidyltransferase-like protein